MSRYKGAARVESSASRSVRTRELASSASSDRVSPRKSGLSARGGAVEAQHFDLGGHDLRWPGEHRKAARHGNFLRTVRGIGNHTAGDRAAELLAPKFLAVGGIERIEVAAQIAEEHDPAGRRSHSADDRVV